MASTSSETCVKCLKCKVIVTNASEQTLKCGNLCGNALHYACSTFKPSEFKFIEGNKNIIWMCDVYIDRSDGVDHSSQETDKHHAIGVKVTILENNVCEMFKCVKELVTKMEKQNEILHNLQKKPVYDVNKENTEQQKSTIDKGPRKISTRSQATDGTLKSRDLKIDIKKEDEKERYKTISVKTIDNKTEEMTQGIDSGKVKNIKSIKHLRGENRNTTLKAVPIRKWIFISNFINSTTEDDIQKHLEGYNILSHVCEKIQTKSTGFAAFKTAVSKEDLERLFNPSIWPKNAVVRHYRNFRRRASIPVSRTTN
ncbi:hypothetical protein QE152_g32184 [Popillia japonica]|uniref:RRM domain-containing protein n=1 Tax=Popillia japonica TaxID=7064 RepID=A0AAW1J062_POPJA